MSEPENTDGCGEELDRQLRLFCYLMLGSAATVEHVMGQIYCRALDQWDEQSERVRLFRIAVDLCEARDGRQKGSTR